MPLNKKWILISVAIVVIILIGVALYFVVRNVNSTAPNTNQATNRATNTNRAVNTPVSNGTTNTNTTTTGTRTEEEDKKSILNLSRIFTERYGSYSNRNNFENITSLEPFMTQRFQNESLQYIAENASEEVPEEYYGVSTYVISLELVEYVAQKTATVRLTTQREESRSDEERKVSTQTALVKLQSVSGAWKADSITWE